MDNSENTRTSIRELGKYGLIDHITGNFRPSNSSTFSRIGDDSAVIEPGKKLMLITTDLMLEGIHFNLIYSPLKHLGSRQL
jgi:thiamine-monophosphate kinase